MRLGKLFLDSADLSLAAAAADSGVVRGITTNPAIMHEHTTHGPAHLRALLDAFKEGPVFYQLTSDNVTAAWAEVAEIDAAAAADRDRVVLKLAAQPWLYSLGARLVEDGRQVAFTAVYDPGQVVCAVDAGAQWIIPYVDRASRLDSGRGSIVPRLAPFVPDDVILLAASIKSASQALSALSDGARAVTTSWAVIEAMMSHPLTDSAVDEFRSIRGSR